MIRAALARLGLGRAAMAGASTEQPWTLAPPTIASRADILACFRLLLGRNPHREEWSGHAMRAGEALDGVVASYLGSLEFSRRGLLAPDAAAPSAALTQLDGFRIYTFADDPLISIPVSHGSYEPEVTAVFREQLRPGMAVLDLGANIGYFTMLAASLVGPEGHVLAIEPNPRNARLIEASRRANGFGHVTICQAAAARSIGVLSLHTSYSNGTTSLLPDEVQSSPAAQTVGCLPVDVLVTPGRRIGLVKVDVEGAEYNALLGAEQMLRRDRPVIISEFSPDMMPGISGVSGEAYLAWLLALDYRLAVIRTAGPPLECGRSIEAVMRAYHEGAVDHIDLVATPLQPEA